MRARRVWTHALEAWTAVLRQAPDDAGAQRWHARCVERLSTPDADPSVFAERSSEGIDTLVKCARLLSKQSDGCDAALEAWDQVLIEQPGHAEAHAARCRCLAQGERWPDLPAAAKAALPYVSPRVLWRLARQATKQQRWPEALALWKLVAERPAADIPLARLVEAQMLCALRLGLDAYVPKIPAPTHTTSEAGPSASGPRPRLTNSAPRHVVITGVSFCGSTLLGLVLGGLPGVANVGESHWLVQKRRSRSSEDLPTSPGGFEQCMSCGPDCPIVTDRLRQRLADRSADFYATLGAAYGADIVVTSDKSPHHVLTLDPYLHNDAIVLFRHPMANWQSHRARHPAFASPHGQRRYFKDWADTYDVLLRYFHNTGEKIVVSFDDFATAPHRTLELICTPLRLPYDPSAVSYWRTKQHFVGGNILLALRLQSGDEDALEISPAATVPHAAAVPEAADEFARALEVWDNLKRRQVRTTGA